VPELPEHRPIVRNTGRPPATSSTAFERDCKRHGPSVFYRFASGKVACKRCIGEAVTRRHQKIKRTLVAEAGGCCRVCGYDRCVFSLHFHHVDPTTKAFGITTAHGKSLAAYREEAKKCVLVCANCHGEIECGLIESPLPYYDTGDSSEASDAAA